MLNVKNNIVSRKIKYFFNITRSFYLFFDEALKSLNSNFDFDKNQNLFFNPQKIDFTKIF